MEQAPRQVRRRTRAPSALSLCPLLNRYYRRIECYTMQWEDIYLSKMVVAGARFGGPVATIRDEGKLVRLGAEAAQPILKIFSASGRLLSAIKWTESRIVAMAWSDSEQLVVVLRSGSVCVYSMHGELLNLFSIGLMQDEVNSCAEVSHVTAISRPSHFSRWKARLYGARALQSLPPAISCTLWRI
jgi:hypothetical protein